MNISNWLKKLHAPDWSYAMQVYALGLVIGVGLVVGIGLQVAQAWNPPTANPPGNNVGEPITASGAAQTKEGSFGTNGNLLVIGTIETTGRIVNNWSPSTNWDVWIQGGPLGATGGTRNLAVAGNTANANDTLYINYQSDYTAGTIIGGPVTALTKLTASKICLPNSIESNCRTSWADISNSYNNLPSGALAGYCRGGGTIGGRLVPPIYRPAYEIISPQARCACEAGWTLIMTGTSEIDGGGGDNGNSGLLNTTCIKD